MCSNNRGFPLSFSELVIFLQQPPFEPCARELDFLDPDEYEKAFTEMVNRYSRAISGVIARITQDPATAAELAQDVFINLYKARISFAPSYIYRAAKNAAYSELRRRKRESNALYAHWRGIKIDKKSKDFDPPDTQPLPDARLLLRRREEALTQALDWLPERFRIPVKLFAEGKSYRQITLLTNINEGMVKSRICHGKRLLRRRLRAYL